MLLIPPSSLSSSSSRRSHGDGGGVGRDDEDGYSILLDAIRMVEFGVLYMDNVFCVVSALLHVL